MKKIVLGAILVLFITIGGGVYYLLSNLDDLVKTAIETYGSQAAQTSVRVQRVKIGLRDGSGSIRGLTVANPAGFSAPQVFSLGEISTQIDLDSISEDLVAIKSITVRAPEIFFELNAAGANNLNVLKQQLPTGSGGGTAAPSATQAQGPGAPKLLVRKLLFAEGKIHAKVVPLNKEYELKLPKIELTNLGGSQGATPAQIADQVLKVLTDRAMIEIQKQGLDQYKAQLEDKLNKRLDAEKKKLDKKVREQVGEQLGNQLNEQLGDQLKGLLNNGK